MDFSKHKDKFKIEINDTPFGAITKYLVSKETDTESEEIEKPHHYIITIRRRYDQRGQREVVNLYGFDKVKFAVTRLGYKITYPACTIRQIIEDISEEDKLIYQTVVLCAKTRTRERVYD